MYPVYFIGIYPGKPAHQVASLAASYLIDKTFIVIFSHQSPYAESLQPKGMNCYPRQVGLHHCKPDCFNAKAQVAGILFPA